jgi:hypothetical protein
MLNGGNADKSPSKKMTNRPSTKGVNAEKDFMKNKGKKFPLGNERLLPRSLFEIAGNSVFAFVQN